MHYWSYYGEQCWANLFGLGSIGVYKVIFLFCVWAGSVFQAQAVLDFSDLMILGMALPNVLGVVLLSGNLFTWQFDRECRRYDREIS